MKRLKILIASFDTMPGISGGWTTPIDLLGNDHSLTYLVTQGRTGKYVLENTPVCRPWFLLPERTPKSWPVHIDRWLNIRLFSIILKKMVKKGQFDCIICLDLAAAYAAWKVDLRYILRFHDYPVDTKTFEKVRENAILVTSVDPSLPDSLYVPHGIDVSRFEYNEFPAAERVVLVATLHDITNPLFFIRAVNNSKLPGTIYGSGPLKNAVIRECGKTNGKVSYGGYIYRNDLNKVYKNYQIGVANINRKRNPYIMKISEYQACGIFPVVQEGCHLAEKAPHLCKIYRNEQELTEQINWVADHWGELWQTRRENRRFVEREYDSRKIKGRFLEKLEEVI